MNEKHYIKYLKSSIYRQQGMTTLIISTLLLFAISLISLFSTKSIILEQKISANAYRSEQALFNADAALNFTSSYINDSQLYKARQEFDKGIFSQLKEDSFGLAKLSDLLIKPKFSEIKVNGYSDDKSSSRSAGLLVAAVPIAGNGMGKVVTYPLITRLGVERTDQLFVYNSHKASTIWSGGEVLLADSSTYIAAAANSAKGEVSLFQISGTGLGNGIDIIEKDFNLRQLSTKAFFENFLNESASFIKRLTKDNLNYFSVSETQKLDGKNGLIWLGDGEKQITLNNAQIGTKEEPVILIVDSSDGIFTTRGDITLYGLLYIRGNWFQTGKLNVYGAVIVEGKMIETINPELVKTMIDYQPDMLKPEKALAGTLSSVIGSWKDF